MLKDASTKSQNYCTCRTSRIGICGQWLERWFGWNPLFWGGGITWTQVQEGMRARENIFLPKYFCFLGSKRTTPHFCRLFAQKCPRLGLGSIDTFILPYLLLYLVEIVRTFLLWSLVSSPGPPKISLDRNPLLPRDQAYNPNPLWSCDKVNRRKSMVTSPHAWLCGSESYGKVLQKVKMLPQNRKRVPNSSCFKDCWIDYAITIIRGTGGRNKSSRIWPVQLGLGAD